VVSRVTISRLSMPLWSSVHAVSAMPPAPATAKTREATAPASEMS
jgi:hypothetical protein